MLSRVAASDLRSDRRYEVDTRPAWTHVSDSDGTRKNLLDMRRHARVDAKGRVTLRLAARQGRARLQDISEGGCRLSNCIPALASGQRVGVSLFAQSGELIGNVEARVAWASDHHAGLKFVEVTERSVEAIRTTMRDSAGG